MIYDRKDLDLAVDTIRKGGIILYPTDTVWGIGCDATNPEAVDKIFKLKKRADAKSMLMLVGSEYQLEQWVENVPDVAWQLIEAAVKPTTIIYDHPIGIANTLLAADGSAGFRLTQDAFCKAICAKLRKPIVSTSANISGEKTPASFMEISPEIINGVDYVVQFRRNDKRKSKPSNIIKISDSGIFKIIR
ncbi:MAG: threonylcarbamoyl-AMP synthase [Muribaculaceae bacterium]|nr:threonylcarbamoyl-AMP synthase [Muribaculaceae bacterium]